MKSIDAKTLEALWHDADTREERLREIVTERMVLAPPPVQDDSILATYFFAFRTQTLEEAAPEIAYHATSGTKNPPPGSLLEECTSKLVGVEAFDSTGRMGLLHMAFPLKMMLQPDRHLTSCDILHTVAGAIIFDVYENLDARLIALQLPEKVIRSFPGPAWGPREFGSGLDLASASRPSAPFLNRLLELLPPRWAHWLRTSPPAPCSSSSRKTRTSIPDWIIRLRRNGLARRSRPSNARGNDEGVW